MLASAVAVAGYQSASAPYVQEYRLKAAFLYNVTQFVEWPPERFSSADAPFFICIMGEDPFGDLLDQVVQARKTHGRSLVIVRLRTYDKPPGCHVLFLIESRRWQLAKLQDRLAAESVLTVSEGKDFVEQGGVVGLVMNDDQVRMEINFAAAVRARLQVSSRLLALASVVVHGPGQTIRK
jgi:hypothetical protein